MSLRCRAGRPTDQKLGTATDTLGTIRRMRLARCELIPDSEANAYTMEMRQEYIVIAVRTDDRAACDFWRSVQCRNASMCAFMLAMSHEVDPGSPIRAPRPSSPS